MATSRTLKGPTDAVLTHITPMLFQTVAEDAYGAEAAGVSLMRRLAVPDDALSRLGQMLAAEVEAGGPGGELMLDLLGRAIALHLLRHHSNLAPATPEQSGRIAGGRLRRVLDHIHAHLHETLSLTELATRSGLRVHRNSRGFRATTGRAPHRYVNDLRLQLSMCPPTLSASISRMAPEFHDP